MSAIRELKSILSDRDDITGTIVSSTNTAFRVSTRKGTVTVPIVSGYKVGDKVHILKGAIVQKLNSASTKVFSV